jgi:hypothetical protein
MLKFAWSVLGGVFDRGHADGLGVAARMLRTLALQGIIQAGLLTAVAQGVGEQYGLGLNPRGWLGRHLDGARKTKRKALLWTCVLTSTANGFAPVIVPRLQDERGKLFLVLVALELILGSAVLSTREATTTFHKSFRQGRRRAVARCERAIALLERRGRGAEVAVARASLVAGNIQQAYNAVRQIQRVERRLAQKAAANRRSPASAAFVSGGTTAKAKRRWCTKQLESGPRKGRVCGWGPNGETCPYPEHRRYWTQR